MAVQRALVFKVGSVGPKCSAYQVAIDKDAGTLRTLRQCSNDAGVFWRGTSLCVACFRTIARSELGVLKVVR
jgi:hypothetical protein